MKWVRVCSAHETEIHTKYLSENLWERVHLTDTGVDERIILE
jgi:hypothetical protein